MIQPPAASAVQHRLTVSTALNLLVGLGLLLGVAGLIQQWRVLPATFLFAAGATFGLIAAVLWAGLPPQLPGSRLGVANQVTLLRAGLVALLAGLTAGPLAAADRWLVLVLALLVLLLDGVDGWLARRHGTATAFGARFDMETDALLIVVLTVLVYRLDQAGGWVLLAGALRYLFVVAGQAQPWLRRPLPYRRRRQTGCVLQIGALLGCLPPPVRPPVSQWLAAGGLLLLIASFAVDVRWLWCQRSLPISPPEE